MKISESGNIDFNTIDTIIFDWGGVITNISPEATIKAFTNLGHKSFEKYFDPSNHDDLFLRFEQGKASDEEIIERLHEEIGKPVPAERLKSALCAMILDTPATRLKILENLRKKFRLILLSNTNYIHVTYYNNYLLKKYRIDFKSLFHKVYYSCEIGMRKPDPEIYRYVLSDSGLEGKKTLFIDDTEINIRVARSMNIQGFHLNNRMTIEELFSDYTGNKPFYKPCNLNDEFQLINKIP